MEIHDLVGLGKSLDKFLDIFARATGSLYKPKAMRNEADAKAYEIRVLGNANLDVEINRIKALGFNDSSTEIAISNPEDDFMNRARHRLVNRELKRQQNLESIAEKTIENLTAQSSSAPVDEDWITRFFNIAEDISNDDMQSLFSKILAGEIARPKTFSLRTLEVFRNLTSEEAAIFQRARYLAANGGHLFKIGNAYDFENFGLAYSDLMVLRSCGLMHDNDALSFNFNPSAKGEPATFGYNGIYITVSRAPNEKLQLEQTPFTPEGIELMQLIEPAPNLEYLKAFSAALPNRTVMYGPDAENLSEI